MEQWQARLRRALSKRLGCRRAPLKNSRPIISFTFDDFPSSALSTAGEILRKHKAAGTYYAALGLMGKDSPVGPIFSLEELKQFVANGHELGCHTYGHCSAWETAPSKFEESIRENRRWLDELLPGGRFPTLSYPITEPRPSTKKRAGKYFACCRGGGQTYNSGQVDLNCVQAFFLEQCGNRTELPKDIIERACRDRGWLVFATHDVCDKPGRFGVTTQFFEEIVKHAAASGAEVLSMSEAVSACCPSKP